MPVTDTSLIEVDLQIADRLIHSGNATTYYADLRQTFLECYKKDEYFQISVLGLDTATWRLRGRSRIQHEVHFQKARQRIGGILMQWHGRLVLPPASNQAFTEYLQKELQVTPDAAPFSCGSPRSFPLCSVDRRPRQPPARRTRRGLRSEHQRGP